MQEPDQTSFFDALIEIDPDNAEAYCGRGIMRRMSGELDHAVSDFDRAIDLEPERAEAYVARGDTLRRQGKHTQALSDLNVAISLNPTSAEAHFTRARIHDATGRHEQASRDLAEARKLDPQLVRDLVDAVEAYMTGGTKNMISTIAESDQGIKNYHYHIKTAIFYREMGQNEYALEHLCRAIELNPEDVNTYILRAGIHQEQANYEDAIADFSKAIESGPAEVKADVYVGRAVNHQLKGNSQSAIEDYGEAIRLNPQYPYSHFGRGTLYHTLGKHDLEVWPESHWPGFALRQADVLQAY